MPSKDGLGAMDRILYKTVASLPAPFNFQQPSMCSFTFAAAVATSFLSTASMAAVTPRQIVESQHGTTVSPASGSTIAAGAAFSFSYTNENLCHSGYTPISVYLSTSAPTSSDVNSSGGLADGSYVSHFGDYLMANFGYSPASHTLLKC